MLEKKHRKISLRAYLYTNRLQVYLLYGRNRREEMQTERDHYNIYIHTYKICIQVPASLSKNKDVRYVITIN